MSEKKVKVKYIGNLKSDTAFDEISSRLQKEKGIGKKEADEQAGKILSATKSKKKENEQESKKINEKKIKNFKELLDYFKFEIGKDLHLSYGDDYRDSKDREKNLEYIEVFMDYDFERILKKINHINNLKTGKNNRNNYMIYIS